MISNPTSKGKTSEAVILAALVRLGKSVLIPWGEERYDYAALGAEADLVTVMAYEYRGPFSGPGSVAP